MVHKDIWCSPSRTFVRCTRAAIGIANRRPFFVHACLGYKIVVPAWANQTNMSHYMGAMGKTCMRETMVIVWQQSDDGAVCGAYDGTRGALDAANVML